MVKLRANGKGWVLLIEPINPTMKIEEIEHFPEIEGEFAVIEEPKQIEQIEGPKLIEKIGRRL